jgi:hypothetical protein
MIDFLDYLFRISLGYGQRVKLNGSYCFLNAETLRWGCVQFCYMECNPVSD